MYDYLEDILAEAPSNFDGKDVTPAISELFFVNETHRKLDTATADLFHRIVTRFLLWPRERDLIYKLQWYSYANK